jgi:O-antigen/teichoic acid export membrane protein
MVRIKSLLTSVRGLLSGKEETLGSIVARGVSGSFVLKVWYTLWSFGVSVLLARILDTNGFGIYSIAISWSALIVVFAKLGQDQTVCRYVASYRESRDYPGLRGLVLFSVLLVLAVGLLLATGAYVMLHVFFTQLDPVTKETLLLAFWLVPLQAVMTSFGAVCQGYSKIIRAQIPVLLVSPLVFLALLTFATDFYQSAVSPSGVIACTLASQAVGLGVLILLTRSVLPPDFAQVKAQFRVKDWVGTAIPVTLMGGMYVINMNADIVMLGALANADLAGIYKAATRGADIVMFPSAMISLSLAPLISRLHTAGDMQRLQRGITKTTRVGVALALPVAIVLLLFSDWFLGLFGSEFTAGSGALRLLIAAQTITALAGPAGWILVMSGHEKSAATGLGVSVVLNIILNALLIPKFGLNGAAAATMISTLCWNLILVAAVRKRLKLDASVIGMRIGKH